MLNPSQKFTLALDQGTTSSRAIIFDENLKPLAVSQQDLPQHFPASGLVEHDPQDIANTTIATARAVIDKTNLAPADIAGIGITNQRETTIIWDRQTGQPIYRALVWQDRRTAEFCRQLKDAGHEEMITAKTGLLLDPYFSASKITYLLDTIPDARTRAEAGELAFGTVDTWLIWVLTGGKTHATDATNASRTMIYNIHEGDWDDDLLALFRIPRAILPDVKNSMDDYGTADPKFFGAEIPIYGVAGDQQAASMGQACFTPGMMKSTYGTGCFALLNTGTTAIPSHNKLLTTIAYQFDGKPHYALEGSIFIAGAVVQWLRDGLGIIRAASDSGKIALASDRDDLIMVPAFTGLGAPYWQPECRGAIYGLTRDTAPKDFARAALKSVAYQTKDLLDAMLDDWQAAGQSPLTPQIRIDGGMAASDTVAQMIADTSGAIVDRPQFIETTALGAAWLAGAKAGLYPDHHHLEEFWQRDRSFTPQTDDAERSRDYARWQTAIKATIMTSSISSPL